MRCPARPLVLALLLAACSVDEDPGDDGSTTATTGLMTSTGVLATTTDATTTVTGTPDPTDSTAQPSDPTGVPPTCGDGELDDYESCDDGPYNADDAACTTACRFATCGDGLVHAGFEACDDGNTYNTDACLNGCIVASCGDGFRGPGEACDDGNADDDDACPNSCSGGGCGDGFVQVGEECDDANANDSDTCSNTCKKPTCSDGQRNGFETDTDCGGVYCGGCLLGQKCNGNLDCGDGICKQNTCTTAQPLDPPNCAVADVDAGQAYNAIKQSCGCHGGGAGGLKFTSTDSFRDNMRNVPAQTAVLDLVEPGDVAQSYLIFKILNQQGKVIGGRGNPMPLGKPLSDSQKCLLINWVRGGAN